MLVNTDPNFTAVLVLLFNPLPTPVHSLPLASIQQEWFQQTFDDLPPVVNSEQKASDFQ